MGGDQERRHGLAHFRKPKEVRGEPMAVVDPNLYEDVLKRCGVSPEDVIRSRVNLERTLESRDREHRNFVARSMHTVFDSLTRPSTGPEPVRVQAQVGTIRDN